MMEEDRKAAEGRARAITKELKKDITELKSRDAEMEKILHTDDHLHILQVCMFVLYIEVLLWFCFKTQI